MKEREHVTELHSYGDVGTGHSVVYEKGAAFLADCAAVEDWGCGRGWFRQFVKAPYKGIDMGVDGRFADNDFVDEYADLKTYTSKVEGIWMRAVLEHNWEWRSILTNAVKSFTKKLCLVIFTPLVEEEIALAVYGEEKGFHGYTVPDLAFTLGDITSHFEGCEWEIEHIDNKSQYGEETLFYVTKR